VGSIIIQIEKLFLLSINNSNASANEKVLSLKLPYTPKLPNSSIILTNFFTPSRNLYGASFQVPSGNAGRSKYSVCQKWRVSP